MIVYPEGLGFDVPADFFTTATNRTEKTVEVVGWYREAFIHHIGIFDWSCSPEDPCEGGQTQPSWIWYRPFDTDPCYLTEGPDPAGDVHTSMYYENSTFRTPEGWTNQVRFFNYCSSDWDVVYEHEYGGTLRDCSIDNYCAHWGPIVENNHPLDDGKPYPKLGFWDTKLVHDGVTTLLTPDNTNWNGPPATWELCYLEPNHSWSVSGVACDPSPLTAQVRITSNSGTQYCAEVDVVNGTSNAVTGWTLELDVHESQLNNSWSGAFTAQSAHQYDVTPLFWNETVPAGGKATVGFCANKTGANWNPTATIGE